VPPLYNFKNKIDDIFNQGKINAKAPEKKVFIWPYISFVGGFDVKSD